MFSILMVMSLTGAQIVAAQSLTVDPQDFQFRACANTPGPNGTDSKTYTLTNNGTNRVVVQEMKFQDNGPWSAADFPDGDKELGPGKSFNITVRFTPTEQGNQTNSITYDLKVLIPPHGDASYSRRISLSGEGLAPCPPAGQDDSGGQGTTGSTGTEAGDGDTAPMRPIIDVCITFHIVTKTGPPQNADDNPDTRPSSEDIDGWVRDANRVFAGAGIRFRRVPPPNTNRDPSLVEKMDESNPEYNPHCLNIYIRHEDRWPGPVTGKTKGPRSKRLNDALGRLGASPGYKRHSGMGRNIELERGDKASDTLAHELGHALGLGAGPEDDHLDPETGRKIDELDPQGRDRLMHPDGDGTGLTELEKKIARAAAEIHNTDASACEQSFYYQPDERYASLDPRSDLQASWIENHDAFIRLTAVPYEPIAVGLDLVQLTVRFDNHLNGRADLEILYRSEGQKWFWEASSEIKELPLPDIIFIHTDPLSGIGTEMAHGIFVDIPKQVFADDRGLLGWQVEFLAGKRQGPADRVPKDGFNYFDMTNPSFVLSLDEAMRSLDVVQGEIVPLTGSVSATDTLTDDIDLSLLIWTDSGPVRLPAGQIQQAVRDRWFGEVQIPMGLRPGKYDMALVGTCDFCKRATSFSGSITVGSAPGAIYWVIGLAAVLGVMMVIILILLLRQGQAGAAPQEEVAE